MGSGWFWRLMGALFPFLGFALMALGTVTAGMELREVTRAGHLQIPAPYYVMPGLMVTIGALALLYCVFESRARARLGDEEEAAPPAPAVGQKPSRVTTLLQARDFLPEEPPEGWSIPLAIGGSHRWMLDTKKETVALVLSRQRWMMAVKVFISGLGAKEPVSDARCAEILAHMRNVGEFIEAAADKEYPEIRVWVAIPTGIRPRWRVPRSIPAPRERELSPHLVAARKYLPQKLPDGWSVPVAIGDDHGTEWKDGAWMIGTTDERFIVVCLVTSRGRVKLSVTFFGADAIEMSEGAAVDMLRHFRGVLEFAQTEAVHEGEVPTRTYLGEITPDGGVRAVLN
jgi:hypothetical protein